MSLDKKLHNVRYAWNGVTIAWAEEFSFRLQVGILAFVCALGWLVGISKLEWLFVFLSASIVLSAEIFNTALEEFCDKYKSDPDPHIAKIKDLAAGAVLVASFFAGVIGLIIFVPRFV